MDTDFNEAVVILLLTFIPIKAANTMMMLWYNCTDPGLWNMLEHTVLLLHCGSFSRGDSDMRTTVFAHIGSHYIAYACESSHSPWIMHNARPIICDPPCYWLLGGGGDLVCTFLPKHAADMIIIWLFQYLALGLSMLRGLQLLNIRRLLFFFCGNECAPYLGSIKLAQLFIFANRRL